MSLRNLFHKLQMFFHQRKGFAFHIFALPNEVFTSLQIEAKNKNKNVAQFAVDIIGENLAKRIPSLQLVTIPRNSFVQPDCFVRKGQNTTNFMLKLSLRHIQAIERLSRRTGISINEYTARVLVEQLDTHFGYQFVQHIYLIEPSSLVYRSILSFISQLVNKNAHSVYLLEHEQRLILSFSTSDGNMHEEVTPITFDRVTSKFFYQNLCEMALAQARFGSLRNTILVRIEGCTYLISFVCLNDWVRIVNNGPNE